MPRNPRSRYQLKDHRGRTLIYAARLSELAPDIRACMDVGDAVTVLDTLRGRTLDPQTALDNAK